MRDAESAPPLAVTVLLELGDQLLGRLGERGQRVAVDAVPAAGKLGKIAS